MVTDYGFGTLENSLIEVFHSDLPDIKEAEKLLASGADINALNEYRDENLLSESLRAYDSTYFSKRDKPYENFSLENKANVMCEIIDFFISHGFDVNGFGGCLGAQCLYALSFMTYDRYMIKVTKHLFDIGAKNRTISDNAESFILWICQLLRKKPVLHRICILYMIAVCYEPQSMRIFG